MSHSLAAAAEPVGQSNAADQKQSRLPGAEQARAARVYHLLGELEVFSARGAGALSRWVGNVVAGDERALVVCAASDGTWPIPAGRVLVLPQLTGYARRAQMFRYRAAIPVRLWLLRGVFRELLRRLQPGDTLYIHNRPDYALFFRRVRQRGVRLVLHLHNSHLMRFPTVCCRRMELDLLAFCSSYLMNEAQARPVRARDRRVIPNGADPAIFFPAKTAGPGVGEPGAHGSVPVVLYVGRLVPEKGVHIFAAALRLLVARGVPVAGRAIGDVDWAGAGRSHYARALLETAPANLEIVPTMDGEALANEYRAATLLCCPSTWHEPFGMVNVEAMACALPVVASRVGGIPDIFREGGATLVDPGSPEQLADAVSALVAERTRSRLMGQAGYRAFLRRYQWSSVREAYRAALETVEQPVRR